MQKGEKKGMGEEGIALRNDKKNLRNSLAYI